VSFENRDKNGRKEGYLQGKAENEGENFDSTTPYRGADIFDLYKKRKDDYENGNKSNHKAFPSTKRLSKTRKFLYTKAFPNTVGKEKSVVLFKAGGLACSTRAPLGYRIEGLLFGTLILETGISVKSIAKMMGYIYYRIANQCPNHRPAD
jgi:hypothetical protein